MLPWGVIRGAFGPSDGSVGAHANVPSAIAVLRHAALYLQLPDEIDEAFAVLERHAMQAGTLYPVAVTAVPFLLDIIRRGSLLASRIADLVASYSAIADTLGAPLREQLHDLLADHDLTPWLVQHPRAAGALAIHVPAVRMQLVAAVSRADAIAPEILLALVELDAAPGRSIACATAILDDAAAPAFARMAAAAFLSRFGDGAPDLRTRVDAALPPDAAGALARWVRELWRPRIERPVVAPRLHDAEVVVAADGHVVVHAQGRDVRLPWRGANVAVGDLLKVGITAHGEPKLALVTGADGSVRLVDF